MFEIEEIFGVGPIERSAVDQSKHERFRHQAVKDVVFSQGRISCRNDETFTFHASDVIDGWSFLQCQFVRHRNVWTDFDFAQLRYASVIFSF